MCQRTRYVYERCSHYEGAYTHYCPLRLKWPGPLLACQDLLGDGGQDKHFDTSSLKGYCPKCSLERLKVVKFLRFVDGEYRE